MEENINKLLKLSDPNKKNGNSFFVIKFEQSLYLMNKLINDCGNNTVSAINMNYCVHIILM